MKSMGLKEAFLIIIEVIQDFLKSRCVLYEFSEKLVNRRITSMGRILPENPTRITQS